MRAILPFVAVTLLRAPAGDHTQYVPLTVHEANLLDNGNRLITDRDNHRVVEIAPDGHVIWQLGQTGVAGSDGTHLYGPHNADRLPNGNTVIADSMNGRIIEVTSGKAIVWTYRGGLNWPRDADRLANGNTLINDSRNLRVIEVTPDGTVAWTHAVSALTYDSDRLDSSNTLIGAGAAILEVSRDGSVVWSYAGPPPEEVWITNPTSGIPLYGHIHRPSNFSPQTTYPAVLLCPGGNGAGTAFDAGSAAQQYAELGLIVMHFDPDGRGQNTAGGTYTVEDYCGFLQQDGGHAVLQHLVNLSETDDDNTGILTSSYGITLGTGMVARYPTPPVKFLLDWEGPADRFDTAQPAGHIPHSTSDEAFWAEREAVTFIAEFGGYYLRDQSQVDHVQPDNNHAIAMINQGTHVQYGGAGWCYWTRVNSAGGWTQSAPNPPTSGWN